MLRNYHRRDHKIKYAARVAFTSLAILRWLTKQETSRAALREPKKAQAFFATAFFATFATAFFAGAFFAAAFFAGAFFTAAFFAGAFFAIAFFAVFFAAILKSSLASTRVLRAKAARLCVLLFNPRANS